LWNKKLPEEIRKKGSFLRLKDLEPGKREGDEGGTAIRVVSWANEECFGCEKKINMR